MRNLFKRAWGCSRKRNSVEKIQFLKLNNSFQSRKKAAHKLEVLRNGFKHRNYRMFVFPLFSVILV